MRVLIVTKIFPNPVEPFSAPFNRQQFAKLASLCELHVLATIPWFPGARAFSKWSRAGRLLDVPDSGEVDGIDVRYPRVAHLPRIGPGLSGPLYAASLATAALRYRAKVDVVLGSWAYPDGFAAVVLARMLGVPAAIKLHGSDINVVATLPGPRRGLQWALPRAARIVAVSEPLRQAAIRLGAVPSRVDVVSNGVDRERFRPADRASAREALGLPPGGAVLLYVGHVERHKGSLDLVRAFALLTKARKDVSLVVVGDGAAMGECQRLAGGIAPGVSFVGARPHDEIPRWIAACDTFVLPSWNEGTPNVVIEALACGRRVVATRVGGTPDVITSDALGALVPPRDPPALAAALQESLSRGYDPGLVSSTLSAPDWSQSARALCASLAAACAG